MITEHSFFPCEQRVLQSGWLDELLALLRDSDFRQDLAVLPGFDPTHCGRVQTLREAFARLSA